MVSLTIDFHPVGQGLFSSGEVSISGLPDFNYIYDCGTSSKQALLDAAIVNYQRNNDAIDMVVISHFDRDHISGLEKLLAHTKVKVLLLPMLALEQRLLIAFAENIPISSKYMRFLRDPVTYIMSLPNANVAHIVMVPSSSTEIDVRDSDISEENQREVLEGWPEGLSADLDVNNSDSTPKNVHQLKPGGRLTVRKLFEFVPYNDSSLAPINRHFVNKVKNKIPILTNGLSSASDVKAALSSLKSYYDKKYGSNSTSRNLISLFLYAGILNKANDMYVYTAQRFGKKIYFERHLSLIPKCAVLYTGDGYLNTAQRFDMLKNFLNNRRLGSIGCLQVMHHGAKGNWYKGLAKELSPSVSIFSSDPSHRSLHHPHAEVVKDFLPYTPIQVDKENHVRFSIWCSLTPHDLPTPCMDFLIASSLKL